MARITSAELTNLLVDVESAVNLTQFINIANRMVTKHCVDTAFTADELHDIELYLAAHFYCISRPRPVSESVGGVGESKQHTEAIGLDSNEYGQMAKRLDWSGALASLDNRMRKGLRTSVSLTWMGKENTEFEGDDVTYDS
jgi:hypothetical protein